MLLVGKNNCINYTASKLPKLPLIIKLEIGDDLAFEGKTLDKLYLHLLMAHFVTFSFVSRSSGELIHQSIPAIKKKK